MYEIERELVYRVSKKSDINEHLLTLYALAQQCESVTEFGIRYGDSTVALLAAMSMRRRLGRPAAYVGYDFNPHHVGYTSTLFGMCPARIDATAICGDSRDVSIKPTCMLFIDTQHNGATVFKEITKHAHKVKRYLVFHDTVTFGLNGETEPEGLLSGIHRAFTQLNDDTWRKVLEFENNNGLTVYERIKP